MKKKLLFLLVIVSILVLALASCRNKGVTKLEIIDGTFRYEYELGETVDLSGLKVKASYNDGSYREIGAEDLTLSTIDTSTTGTKQFTIEYDGYKLTVDVKVVKELTDDTPEVTLSGIAIDSTSVLTKVDVGSVYSTSDITATATYSDGTTKALTAADLTVTSIDTSVAGDKTLVATYEDKTAELTVSVLGVKSMQIYGAPTSITQGEALNTAGVLAIVTMTNDEPRNVSAAELSFSAIDTATAGTKTVTVSYLDGQTTFDVVVNPIAEIIGIDVNTTNIAQYITGIPDGTDLDLAAIKAGVIVYLNYGYAGSSSIVRTETLSDNSVLTVTEVTNGSARAVKVAYGSFEKLITILEGDAVVEAIAIDAGFVNYVKLGGVFNPGSLTISATLSNGSTVHYPIGTTGLTLSGIDTSAAGTKTLTATYEGLTATASVYVLPVASITVIGSPDLRVAKGGTLDYSALTFTVIYAEGGYSVTETVAIADMTVGSIDVATAGNKSFTVSYKGGSGSVSYLVKEMTSIALKMPADGNLDGITKLQVGSSINENALEYILTWSDGSTETVTKANGVTLTGTDALAAAGNHNITINYGGITGTFQVNVNEYIIMGVSKPDSLVALENKADGSVSGKIGYFLDHSDTTYVVGDDNPYRLTLNLLALDENYDEVTITNYTSSSLVYIIEGGVERLLSGTELAEYVEINEAKNTFDFTSAAVGKIFKIATRPANGILDSQIASFTRTHTVKIVDGWNIHDVKELNVITNWDHTNGQVAAAHAFLDANGIARPSGAIAGIILHGDMHITTNDLPPEYLIDTGVNDAFGNDIYNIYTGFAIYPHSIDASMPEFTMYGNYYTIFSYGVPLVNDVEGRSGGFGVDNGEKVSTSQLFMIDNKDAVGTGAASYDNMNYKFNMQNLYLMDDDPNNPTGTAEESARAMRGLIGIKMRHVVADCKNIVIERYYISFFPDMDYVDATLTYGKLYNAWQNHVFIFGDNTIQSKGDGKGGEAPLGGLGNNPTLNIVNSEITVCGGPAIISQTRNKDQVTGDDLLCNMYSSPDVTIDANTKIYTYVQSSAAWFSAFNATAEAALIEGMETMIAGKYGSRFTVKNPLSGYNGRFMNIIMLNMSAGYSFGGEAGDIDGTLTIGGTQVLNMKDSNAVNAMGALMYQGYSQEDAVAAVLGGYSDVADYSGNLAVDIILYQNSAAPVFQTTLGTAGSATAGSTAYFDGTNLVAPFSGEYGLAGVLGTSDPQYITLYYAGMGIVFGDYHACSDAGCGVCK